MIAPLTLSPRALAWIRALARAASPAECLGLLASSRGCATVTAVAALPAGATNASAEASPLAIRTAAVALADNGLIARGIWHSHGRFAVSHSATDRATLERLLPALAADNAVRDLPISAPAVLGRDAAVLPLDDGRLLSFKLRGAEVPTSDVFEPAEWSRIDTSFAAAPGPSAATLSGAEIRLFGAGVTLSLSIPAGAVVMTSVAEPSLNRVSFLYSLVVNALGDSEAQCLVVTEFGAERTTRLVACGLVVTAPDGDAEPPEILR